jgi:hypothetical protein
VSAITSEMKLQAAVQLALGAGHNEAADLAGISRVTLWRLKNDDEEFRRIRQELADATVAQAVQDLRALSADTIRVFREALGATVEERDGEETIVRPDTATRLRAADIVTKRIAEFAPKLSVSVSGSLEERLRDLDDELTGPAEG